MGRLVVSEIHPAAAALVFLFAAACASPVVTTELNRIDQFSGYRYEMLEQGAPKAFKDAAVMLSFSGGGTRAAALADGVLRALAETEIGTGTAVPLSSEINIISSVSGGSVTAAYFGLNGVDGLATLENDLLYVNAERELIRRTLRNPFQLFYPRIGILQRYFDATLFHQKTYQDLIANDKAGRDRRPYIILNAADMASGSVFSFTQDQFDLICGDLRSFKISNAVAASAAFPVVFSALTIANRSPCAAQNNAPSDVRSGWESASGFPEPTRVANDRAATADHGVNYPEAGNLARYRRGTTSLTYLNRDGQKNYVQLLDGGVAENLGLTKPLSLLISQGESPSVLSWINRGEIDKLLFVIVNARSDPSSDFGKRQRPPGAIDTLVATIGTPIDATSFQLLGQVDTIIDATAADAAVRPVAPKSIVVVDFERIADEDCRTHFKNIPTTWALPHRDVDDLIALGKALVLQSPEYKEFVAAFNKAAPAPARSVDDICSPYRIAAPPRM